MPAAKFQGTGEYYVNGVPARDLTHEAYDELTDDQKRAVLNARGGDGKLLYSVSGATAERERLGMVSGGDGEPATEVAEATPDASAAPAEAPASRRATSKGGE